MREFSEPQRFWVDLFTIVALGLALWISRPGAAVLVEGPAAAARR